MSTIKAFISQPMRDKTNEQILTERTHAIKEIKKQYGDDVVVLDSFFQGAPHNANPLWFLGQSIIILSQADVAYFIGDWKEYRGCKAENMLAHAYGIKTIEEQEVIMKVIDISDWQEGINFDDIVNAGVEGVIIKALNGQSPTACVYDLIDECRKRGLPWGVYCYTRAWTPDDARSEAHAMLNLLGGETPPLGIWYDIEDDPDTLPNPVKWLTGVDDPTGRCSAFISELNAAGQAAGIYAGYYALRDYIATNELADYVPIWYNQYNSTCDYGEVCSLPLAGWQYTNTGRIDGWNYDLDMNEWYK